MTWTTGIKRIKKNASQVMLYGHKRNLKHRGIPEIYPFVLWRILNDVVQTVCRPHISCWSRRTRQTDTTSKQIHSTQSYVRPEAAAVVPCAFCSIRRVLSPCALSWRFLLMRDDGDQKCKCRRLPAAVRAAAQPIGASASGQPAAFPLSACTSTGPGSTNGLFVLHFLTAVHRQECLWGAAAAAPTAAAAAAAAGKQKGSAGTQPGVSPPCQMGRWSSGGWAARVRDAIKAHCGAHRPARLEPQQWKPAVPQLHLARWRFLLRMCNSFLAVHHKITTIVGPTLDFSQRFLSEKSISSPAQWEEEHEGEEEEPTRPNSWRTPQWRTVQFYASGDKLHHSAKTPCHPTVMQIKGNSMLHSILKAKLVLQ